MAWLRCPKRAPGYAATLATSMGQVAFCLLWGCILALAPLRDHRCGLLADAPAGHPARERRPAPGEAVRGGPFIRALPVSPKGPLSSESDEKRIA